MAHAFDTSLPGWLVIVPRRHVLSLSALDPQEAAELGPLLPDQPEHQRGPRIFARLGRPEGDRVPGSERERLARALREVVGR